MRYSLPPVGSGWRGMAENAAQTRPRNRLSDGWWIVCDPASTRLTVDLRGEGAAAALALVGTVGPSDLHVEVTLDPALLDRPPQSLSFRLAGVGPTTGSLKRIAVRRRSASAPDAVRRLWWAGGPIAFATDQATVSIDEEAGAAIVALLRDAAGRGDQACLMLTFGAGPIDLQLGSVAFGGGPPAARSGTLPRQGSVEAADDNQLTVQLRELVARELPRRLREHLHAEDWAALDRLGSVVDELAKPLARAAAFVGRGRVLRGEHAAAAGAFDLATRLQPDGEEPRLSLGLALARGDDLSRGIEELRTVLARGGSSRVRLELARALRRRVREPADSARVAEDRREAIVLLRGLPDPELDGTPRMMLADLLYEERGYADCLATLDGGTVDEASHVAGLMLRSRVLVALDRIDESLVSAQAVLTADPGHAAAAFHLRTLRHFGSAAARTGVRHAVPVPTGEGFSARLAACEADWVLPVDPDRAGNPAQDSLPEPATGDGFVPVSISGVRAGAWRRDCLANLVASGLVEPDLSGLDKYEAIYGARPAVSTGDDDRGGTVVLMSRYGSFKFGGGEQFLEGMAGHYRSIGLDPLIIGTRPEQTGERGVTAAGHRFAFIEPTVPALLRCLIDHDARLVHAISGSGFLAAGAVAHSHIRLIYGIHYWRELLGDEADHNFFLEDGAPNPRLAFGYILSYADAVYANSLWVRSVVERCFGVRVPVVHSVPADLAA